jgi:ABC-type nitrate/sulfonate/bicarbonate transport system substrate-binding protein
VKRRDFLHGAAAGLALAATSAPACADTPVTTQLLWIKDVQAAGFWLADAEGYFRAEGITSTILAGGPNLGSPESFVVGGRADVGIDQLERIVDAINAGADLVVLGAIYQRSPAGILSLPTRPIRTAHDILGKRMGLQQGGNLYIDGILNLHRLPHDYTEVVVGFDPQPLVEGACDGYLCYVTNQPLTLAEHGTKAVAVTFEQLGFADYGECLFCTRDYLSKNRSTLVKYLRAVRRGWTANLRDPAPAARLAARTYGESLALDETQETAQNRAQTPLTQSALTRAHGLLWIDEHRIAGPIYASLRATGRTKLPPVNRLLDLSVLRDAAA